jgi:hypothetical protein
LKICISLFIRTRHRYIDSAFFTKKGAISLKKIKPKEGIMYMKALSISLMVAVGAVCGMLHSPGISGEKANLPQFYENCIVKMIEKCESQTRLLRTSSATDLRNYARVQAQIARFLSAEKETLVNIMIQLQLEPKEYKIERFLDDQFYKFLANNTH